MPAVLTILYPRTETSTFDLDYYLKNHMPLCAKYWYPRGLTHYNVEQLGDGPYAIKASCYWDAMDSFQKAVTVQEEIGQIFGDVKNYTNVTPVQLFGEIVGDGEKPKL